MLVLACLHSVAMRVRPASTATAVARERMDERTLHVEKGQGLAEKGRAEEANVLKSEFLGEYEP